MIKVAFIARSSLFDVRGGDTTQVLQTAEGLRKSGVEVSIFKASDRIEYHKFDLLHFFNIIRPADHLYHIRKSRKPFVISTIYLDYGPFDRTGRGPVMRRFLKAIGKFNSEYLKNIFRFLKKQDRLVSPEYLLGHKRAMKEIFRRASLLLPNSHSEYQRLSNDLGLTGDYVFVPNGVEKKFFLNPPKVERERKVLSVAQLYGRKNQHSLIKACNELEVPLMIIGKTPPNHSKYLDYCKEIAGKNVSFHEHIPFEELIGPYASAKVHALPSWFETTGLTTLEAGAMGCNLVVGECGDTREYFHDIAEFCDPGDINSIKEAVKKALDSPSDDRAREKILAMYTWDKAAEATLAAYKKVLNYEG